MIQLESFFLLSFTIPHSVFIIAFTVDLSEARRLASACLLLKANLSRTRAEKEREARRVQLGY
jgi:hypothetical protein